MQNPLQSNQADTDDITLINEALSGNRKSLNTLLEKHNNYIFNIAIRVLGNQPAAEDATQDILIKLITNLSSYNPEKARFTTWLYRVAFNHLLNFKRSKTEQQIKSFDQFFDTIDAVPADESFYYDRADGEIYTEETKIKCTVGMLLCIPREDRLLYVVGDLFNIDSKTAAEIFEISPENFRKKLSRIRADLRSWMNDRCGLVNKSNPCRCRKKTKGFVEIGIVDPDRLMWNSAYTKKIKDLVDQNLEDGLLATDMIYTRIHQDSPFKENALPHDILDEIVSNENFKPFLDQ